jgi:hypothetical protein
MPATPWAIHPAAPPTMKASAAAIAAMRQRAGAARWESISRAGTGSSITPPKRARTARACARHAATLSASPGWAASQASTAARRSSGNSPSTKACSSSSVTGIFGSLISRRPSPCSVSHFT